MLNLSYNEMSNAWNNLDEVEDSRPVFKNDLVLSWKQLSVTVKKKTPRLFGASKVVYKKILSNVSGNVECGTLLGIMGPSGSGKTTLMATISHRTKGNFKGELFLNGRPVSERVMIKISGFVAQEDISFDKLTAFEQLNFMAKFKMDRFANEKVIQGRINYLVKNLGLSTFLYTRLDFLSGGERKKIALAVQLLNDPPILFCDEITTGLDSYSATHIINTLRKVAYSGKIVICTIHQPASGIFDKFHEVVLLTNGRLAYQGPVSLVNELFKKYNYVCPNTYNKADFIISILNSNDTQDKYNVDEMCNLSSTVSQMNMKYNLFNKDVQFEYEHHLESIKPLWITQLLFLLYRSVLCFIRNYKNKLLEFGIFMYLAVITAIPYSNLKFDTKAVQNWQGFWFCLVINSIFHASYGAMYAHNENFSIVHREISNKLYSLSAYYVAEIIIMVIWATIQTLAYSILVFWVVGVKWVYLQLFILVLILLTARSYGSLMSAFFADIEKAITVSLAYDYFSLPLSGAYISFGSLPKLLVYFKYLSLFYLGCESLSIVQWEKVNSIPCIDSHSCLDNGQAVLNHYGFVSENLYMDIVILLIITIIANILAYFGILLRIKKQPPY
ncbi:protein scarlet-like [Daktulosphaira vitifoliae]|uniref:protein scarlet-like n=1 Tax=Daktulosphaira vitifoliae TaxID=58002 RepID=UPI0021A9F19E|nr:protein scarlet-like [Daktulosphaira vitifoliae]